MLFKKRKKRLTAFCTLPALTHTTTLAVQTYGYVLRVCGRVGNFLHVWVCIHWNGKLKRPEGIQNRIGNAFFVKKIQYYFFLLKFLFHISPTWKENLYLIQSKLTSTILHQNFLLLGSREASTNKMITILLITLVTCFRSQARHRSLLNKQQIKYISKSTRRLFDSGLQTCWGMKTISFRHHT